MKKIVLAYSGGLDTTCCVKWLQERGYEVVCFSADLGSEFSPKELKTKAKSSGITKIYVKDLQSEFADSYILPALRAGAVYQNKYVLSTALGRPLIAKHLVDIAHKEKAGYIAHGCTGKGNDQVRIETATTLLDNKLRIIAPVREWELKSREEEIAYVRKHKLPLKITKEKIYSIDKNIWGISVEGGKLEDLDNEPPENSFYFVKPAEKVRDRVCYVSIKFDNGVPVALNGKKASFLSMIKSLNKLGADVGIGRTDLVEDRVVGIKSREIYEAPAAWLLHYAHNELESLTLDRQTQMLKKEIASQYAWLVYQGLWFTQIKRAMDAFIDVTQESVTGEITMKLYKGQISVAKREAKNPLYKKEFATYGAGDKFKQEYSEGFIRLMSMPYSK